jgi:hypothetical protein
MNHDDYRQYFYVFCVYETFLVLSSALRPDILFYALKNIFEILHP